MFILLFVVVIVLIAIFTLVTMYSLKENDSNKSEIVNVPHDAYTLRTVKSEETEFTATNAKAYNLVLSRRNIFNSTTNVSGDVRVGSTYIYISINLPGITAVSGLSEILTCVAPDSGSGKRVRPMSEFDIIMNENWEIHQKSENVYNFWKKV